LADGVYTVDYFGFGGIQLVKDWGHTVELIELASASGWK
jgi:hypothetical protein